MPQLSDICTMVAPHDRSEIEERSLAVADFLALVRLSPAEQALLDTSSSTVAPVEMSDAFFAALERMQRVREECRALQVLSRRPLPLAILHCLECSVRFCFSLARSPHRISALRST